MKKENKQNYEIEKLIKIIILFLFSLVFSLTIIERSVYNFVHQRHIPMIIFAVIVFIISAIVELVYDKKDKHKLNEDDEVMITSGYKKHLSLLIFLIPLVLYFFSGDGIRLSSVVQNLDIKSQLQEKENADQTSSKPNPFTGMPKRTMELIDGKIILTNENFGTWLTEIYTNSYSYYGTEIELSGELWYDKNLPEGEFALGRFMMICCAADMQPVGLLCKSESKQKLEDGDWVKINGILKERLFEGESSEPYIEVILIEKTEKPENSYVSPY